MTGLFLGEHLFIRVCDEPNIGCRMHLLDLFSVSWSYVIPMAFEVSMAFRMGRHHKLIIIAYVMLVTVMVLLLRYM